MNRFYIDAVPGTLVAFSATAVSNFSLLLFFILIYSRYIFSFRAQATLNLTQIMKRSIRIFLMTGLKSSRHLDQKEAKNSLLF
jgi:hypothetical protein